MLLVKRPCVQPNAAPTVWLFSCACRRSCTTLARTDIYLSHWLVLCCIFWEWRAANRRICDYWLAPLATFSPRTMLMYLRYTEDGSEGQPNKGAFNDFDDEVCASPLLVITTCVTTVTAVTDAVAHRFPVHFQSCGSPDAHWSPSSSARPRAIACPRSRITRHPSIFGRPPYSCPTTRCLSRRSTTTRRAWATRSCS
jgi:hypothetical protein